MPVKSLLPEEGQMKAIGLRFVIDSLSPDSPYGVEKIQDAAPFAKRERAQLLDALYNVRQAVAYADDERFAEISLLLHRFKNIRNAIKKCEQSYLHEVELFEVKQFLLLLEKLRFVYNALNEKTCFKHIVLTDMTEALDILDPNKRRLAPFALSEMNNPALMAIRVEKTRLEGLLNSEADQGVRESLKQERLHWVAREEAEETKAKKNLSQALRPFLNAFYENMAHIGELDFTIQKARLALRYGAVCPNIVKDGGDIIFDGMFNPEIADILAKTGKRFTPVSLTLSVGTTILTGANMGGKSVAIKTAVLNMLLGHMGFFVFAEKCAMPLFAGIYLISEDLQSIDQGLSTFGAEIVRLNDVLQHAHTDALFIALDELARGTNPEEGAVIVRAVAKRLNKSRCHCFMSTHYDNVAGVGCAHYQVAGLTHVNFEKWRDAAQKAINGIDAIADQMDYRLVKMHGGQKPPRDALNICRLLALDKHILDEIESILQ